MTAALALGLLAAIGFGALGGSGSTEQPVPAAEVANIQSAWTAATAAGIELPRVTPAQRSSAISAMALPSADRDKLTADVEANKVQLVWVTVWDTYSEDGDVVELSSDGVKSVVVLKNAHTVVALPMPQSGVVTVRGVKDGGGGGITVGIMSGSAPVRIPPMAPNQILGIPVR